MKYNKLILQFIFIINGLGLFSQSFALSPKIISFIKDKLKDGFSITMRPDKTWYMQKKSILYKIVSSDSGESLKQVQFIKNSLYGRTRIYKDLKGRFWGISSNLIIRFDSQYNVIGKTEFKKCIISSHVLFDKDNLYVIGEECTNRGRGSRIQIGIKKLYLIAIDSDCKLKIGPKEIDVRGLEISEFSPHVSFLGDSSIFICGRQKFRPYIDEKLFYDGKYCRIDSSQENFVYWIIDKEGNLIKEPETISFRKNSFRKIPGAHISSHLDLCFLPNGELILSINGMDGRLVYSIDETDKDLTTVLYQVKFLPQGEIVLPEKVETVNFLPIDKIPDIDKVRVREFDFYEKMFKFPSHKKGFSEKGYYFYGHDDEGNLYYSRVIASK